MNSTEGNGRVKLDLSELQEISRGREVFYNFLSRSFEREIDKPFLEMVTNLTPFLEDITKQSDNDSLITGGKIVGEFSTSVCDLDSSAEEELILELKRNFAYLFLIGKGAIPTCSSYYLSPDRLLKQEPYFYVLGTYREIGFVKPEHFKEDEDHIALELLFMAVLSNLINRTIESGENIKASKYLKLQLEFLEGHMLSWIPDACDRLVEIAEHREIYKGIAMLTSGFLAADVEYLTHAEIFSSEG